MTSVANSENTLKKRVMRFFDTESDRKDVCSVIEEFSAVTHIYIYGGLLRDIALYGVSAFKSDIDIVFDKSNFDVELLLQKYNATRNKFGGFRIEIGIWQIDIWEAGKTWAFVHGFRAYRNITSLLETTITNWDAIIFDWKIKKLIYRQRYFEDLRSGHLEICLAENPNEIGMYVRLIRYFAAKEAMTLSQRAVSMLNIAFEKYDFLELAKYERNSYKQVYITPSIYNYMSSNEEIRKPELFPINLERFNRTKSLI